MATLDSTKANKSVSTYCSHAETATVLFDTGGEERLSDWGKGELGLVGAERVILKRASAALTSASVAVSALLGILKYLHADKVVVRVFWGRGGER